MFKVGDRVEMVRKSACSPPVGAKGEIYSVEDEYNLHIYWEDNYLPRGPFNVEEVEKVNNNCPESNHLDEFREAIRQELSNWRDPKQVDGEHYTSLVIQPLDVAYLNDLNSCRTKVLKYVMRDKNGLADLKKAKDMIEKAALYEYGEEI